MTFLGRGSGGGPADEDHIIIIFLSPPAQSRSWTYKIMVATAIYSVTMVLLKETAFPLCRAMERRWKRNVVSRGSSVNIFVVPWSQKKLQEHLTTEKNKTNDSVMQDKNRNQTVRDQTRG